MQFFSLFYHVMLLCTPMGCPSDPSSRPSTPSKLGPLELGENKKSHRARSGEWGGCSSLERFFSARNYWMLRLRPYPGTGIENEEISGNPENFDFFMLFGGSWGNLRVHWRPKIRGISRIRREFPSLYLYFIAISHL